MWGAGRPAVGLAWGVDRARMQLESRIQGPVGRPHSPDSGHVGLLGSAPAIQQRKAMGQLEPPLEQGGECTHKRGSPVHIRRTGFGASLPNSPTQHNLGLCQPRKVILIKAVNSIQDLCASCSPRFLSLPIQEQQVATVCLNRCESTTATGVVNSDGGVNGGCLPLSFLCRMF